MAGIPTESPLVLRESLGSSHYRLTSAEDYARGFTFGLSARSLGTSSICRPTIWPPKSENAPPASRLICVGAAPGGMPDCMAVLSCVTLLNCFVSLSASLDTFAAGFENRLLVDGFRQTSNLLVISCPSPR